MTRPNWLLHVQALGLPGALGLLMLLTSTWGFFVWLPDHQAQADVLASQVRHLRHDLQTDRAVQGRGGSDTNRMVPDQSWQTVWDALPLDSQRIEILKRVTSVASKMGVSSQSIQYRGALEPWSAHAGQALWRQRLTLPVQGRYGDVRAWLGTLLSRPYVSLDTLDIQRSDTASDLVSGRVSLSLWWRVEQGGSP